MSDGENSFVGKSAAYSTHISWWPLIPGILSLPSLPANTHQHRPLPEPPQPGHQALCPLDGIPQEAMSGYSGAVWFNCVWCWSGFTGDHCPGILSTTLQLVHDAAKSTPGSRLWAECQVLFSPLHFLTLRLDSDNVLVLNWTIQTMPTLLWLV